MTGDSPDERTEQWSEPFDTRDYRLGIPTFGVGVTISPASDLAAEDADDPTRYLIGDCDNSSDSADPTGERSDSRAGGDLTVIQQSSEQFTGSLEDAIATGLSRGLDLFAQAVAELESPGRSRNGASEAPGRPEGSSYSTQTIIDLIDRVEKLEGQVNRVIDYIVGPLDRQDLGEITDYEMTEALFQRLRQHGSLA